jgi:hypothetical protein
MKKFLEKVEVDRVEIDGTTFATTLTRAEDGVYPYLQFFNKTGCIYCLFLDPLASFDLLGNKLIGLEKIIREENDKYALVNNKKEYKCFACLEIIDLKSIDVELHIRRKRGVCYPAICFTPKELTSEFQFRYLIEFPVWNNFTQFGAIFINLSFAMTKMKNKYFSESGSTSSSEDTSSTSSEDYESEENSELENIKLEEVEEEEISLLYP